MTSKSPVYANVDFEKSGKQVGYFSIPHSPQEDAWGAVQMPLCIIKNGEGPTAILMGGNHGDEYEGPIILGELIRDLDPGAISGRLIIAPALNLPAAIAGQRTSPVDGLNLNRTFPGDPLGTLTQQITAYVSDHLFPLGDAMMDLHSGGSSLNILPSAIIEPAPDAAHRQRNIDAVLAFDAPLTVVIDNLGDTRTSTSTAVRAGLTTLGTEMAGQGTVTPEAVKVCRRGVHNVLSHLGILPPQPKRQTKKEPGPILRIPGQPGYVFASTDGVFEPFHALGTNVREGQKAGRIHNLAQPWREPEVLHYGIDGVVYSLRQPAGLSLEIAASCLRHHTKVT